MLFIALTLLAALCVEASPLLQACGEGARLAASPTAYFCLYEGINTTIPLSAYCTYLHDGYVGFSWNLTAHPEYVCPKSSRQTGNGWGLGFCLWEGLKFPPYMTNVAAYCHYLDQGYIGYHLNFDLKELVKAVFE